MITFAGSRNSLCDGLSRRTFLQVGALLSGGMSLAGPWCCRGASAPQNQRSAILIYLMGGPSHLETFDPKPEAPAEFRGPYGAIDTNVPGTRVSGTLPLLAKIADKFSLLRCCAHDNSGHGGGNRYVNTGYPSASAEFELPHDYPAIGSIIAKVRGPIVNGLPTYIRCPPSPEIGPAFLGQAYDSFNVQATGKALGSNLAPIIPLERLDDRRQLRRLFDRLERSGQEKARMEAMDELERQAFAMLTRPAARDAFDLSKEPLRLRERYGNHEAGQTFLLARRFIEAGAGFVSVRMGNWDHHGTMNNTVVQGAKKCNPPLDQALSALIADLHERGLSEQTLLWCWGEFGRSPRVNVNAGRDHWPQAMSVLFAGGGLKMGRVVGATTSKGERPADQPVTPGHVLSTVYRQLGIDPSTTFFASGNRPITILNHGAPIDDLI